MKSFLAQMNELRLPRHPFCQDIKNLIPVPFLETTPHPEISKLFPHLNKSAYKFELGHHAKGSKIHKIGVVFSGGQAAGGHNVIWGIYDGLKQLSHNPELIGFLGGPSGIIDNKFKVISEADLAQYHNTGGFDLIGSGRTKIETTQQLEASLMTVKTHRLDALIIIGGDDSNTNAAVLANFFKSNECSCRVIGVPKTIDGDLKNSFIETSFGFDTASKFFSELTSNILRDCLSAKKYFHFVKIMGRTASHLALEVALNTHANLTLISEDLSHHNKTLKDVVIEIRDLIIARSKAGKDYGVILIPEGLIEALVDVKQLLKNLTLAIAHYGKDVVKKHLNESDKRLFELLPDLIQRQLCQDLDPHGNVQVSLIDTEKLLVDLVKLELKKSDFQGKFSPQCHFFGYEGRACYPSYFDLVYTYHLGMGAALGAASELNGYMVCVKNLKHKPSDFVFEAVPLISMMHMEERKGMMEPVIKKALVNLKGDRFKHFMNNKESWKLSDDYRFMGPNQYHGEYHDIYAPPMILGDQA
jgi:diphosphate-dependent phosphofructokinase